MTPAGPDYQVDTLPDLYLDPEQVVRCRKLATRVVQGVFDFIDHHTTVSIERTVLRLFGVAGASPRGIPLCNLMVDRIHQAGALGRGAAYWYGRALRGGAVGSPLDLADALPALLKAGPTSADEERKLREEVRAETRAACDELLARVRTRQELKASLGSSPPPLKYLIVATGNIYEDAEQARAAAQAGADVIAVIRSTAQSLLDYVPHGATTEGYGGTYATQENFRILREALDVESRETGRYVRLVNYCSGLCMPEIAAMGALERLDMMLNDALYGIIFRDINPLRTLIDQNFSRRINAAAGVVINTGEDNYLTTADALEAEHTVVASQFINERFAQIAGIPPEQMGLGHAFEIDPSTPNHLLHEIASAQLIRDLFPGYPIKYMPPTKHMDGDIFRGHILDSFFNFVGVLTGQGIQLLGMPTEAIHTPLLQDRFLAIRNAQYVFNAARDLGEQFDWR